MNKNENAELMRKADEVLRRKDTILEEDGSIYSAYNGQVSALGVSILMIGLKPTIAVYYQDTKRKKLIDVIAKMLDREDGAEGLTREIVRDKDDSLKTRILNCSVALKQVIRTYELRDDYDKQ